MAWHERAGRLADPDPETLKQWLSVSDIKSLVFGFITPALAQAMYDRLLTRELVGAARNARFEKQGRQIPCPYVAIDPSWWPNVEGGMTPLHSFWQTGDVRIVVPARCGDPNTSVLFCDVQFEPDGLRGLLPNPLNLGGTLTRTASPLPPQPPAPRPSLASLPSAPAPPPPEEPANPGRKAEYDEWYTPAEVLSAYSAIFPAETLIRTVAHSLEDGMIRAIARRVVREGEEQSEYAEVPAKAWKGWACLADTDFWTAGTLQRYADEQGFRSTGLKPFRAHRIRLQRSGVDELRHGAVRPPSATERIVQALLKPVPVRLGPATPGLLDLTASPPAQAQGRQRKRNKPLTDVEIKDWHERLTEAERSLSIEALWARAKTDHPGRHLPRKMVEHFGSGRTNGHRSLK
ncbi:MAG: hypothetical protein JWQ46_2091 [Phenylobacterium sp.]|jgi:hypothetical protein|nr:hypothetical protein [Phenylobacterium sp.]